MKKWTITCVLLFCVQFCLIYPIEKQSYLINIEKALEAHQFNGKCESLEDPYLQEKIKALFLQIYEREKEYPDYVQCVTAQDSFFYAYQVIAKELYRMLYGMPRQDFEFLRFPTQNLLKTREEFFSRYSSFILSKEELAKEFKINADKLEKTLEIHERQEEEEFLRISRGEKETHGELNHENECDLEDEEISSRFQTNDTNAEISKELLSVNFTMETYRPLDSAMFVFLSGDSVSLSFLSNDKEEYRKKLFAILHELFHAFSLPREKLVGCLERLIDKAPRTKLGIINQIFIPRENIHSCMYLSFGGGFLHSVYDPIFEESYIAFQNNREDGSFRTFRNFQASVIVGALFENPKIKILRYTLIPKETEREYEAIVREAIGELLASSPAF